MNDPAAIVAQSPLAARHHGDAMRESRLGSALAPVSGLSAAMFELLAEPHRVLLGIVEALDPVGIAASVARERSRIASSGSGTSTRLPADMTRSSNGVDVPDSSPAAATRSPANVPRLVLREICFAPG